MELLSKPKIKSYFEIIQHDEDRLDLVAGPDEILRLRGASVKTFWEMLPFLRGAHTYQDIVTQFKNESMVKSLLDKLVEHSIVEEGEPPDGFSEQELNLLNDQLTFFSHGDLKKGSKYEIQRRLKSAMVVVISAGGTRLGKEITECLSEAGIGCIDVVRFESIDDDARAAEFTNIGSPLATVKFRSVTSIDSVKGALTELLPAQGIVVIVVCLEGVFFPSLLREVNTFCIDSGLPWFSIQGPHNLCGTIGPLFIPGESPCFDCLESRIRSNVEFLEEYDRLEEELKRARKASARYGSIPPFSKMLAAIACCELIKYFSGIGVPAVLGSFISINLFSYEVSSHRVLRVPSCAKCSKTQFHISPWGSELMR